MSSLLYPNRLSPLPLPRLSLRPPNLLPRPSLRPRLRPLRSSSVSPPPDASSAEVPLFLGPDGSYSIDKTPSGDKVVLLWDLDNKPPRGPPYEAALSLRRLASSFGSIVHLSAYANRHAFLHVPAWVLQDRRDRRERDILERQRPPSESYPCSVCGRKFPTHLALRRHFRSLHERERNKKIARMRSLKGKRRRQYRERFLSGNSKYEDAARDLSSFPRAGYGLARELRRAGILVRTVADKPQAADAALKGEMRHWMAGGIDWLFLVSDDSDFSEMVRRAREVETRTVVVGDWRTSLSRHADVWVPWAGVESGQIGEETIRAGGWMVDEGMGASRGGNSVRIGNELDAAIEEIVNGSRSRHGEDRFRSAYSDDKGIRRGLGDEDFRLYGSAEPEEEFFWVSDSEEDDDEAEEEF